MDIKRWLWFVAGGGINTAVTYGIYLALNAALPYQLAYFVAYAIGIVIAYGINSLVVFKVPLSAGRLAVYPAVYVVQYILAALLLATCVEYLNIPEKVAPLLVTAVMVPMSYALNKFILHEELLRGIPMRTLAAVAAVLLLQNLLIFWRHYFDGYSFPWDFLATYHAVPYYWITAVNHHAPIGWVPFQGMGYPFYMNLQSGLFYPAFWLFVLLHHDYTLTAAVLMQTAHIWMAAVGAVVCARLMGVSWARALVAGVLYQGFGAFYSNSEHVDIVRAYALLPWLAAPAFAHWTPRSRLMLLSILIQPVVVYALWTGGYFGVVVGQLFIVGAVVAIRTVWRRDWRIGVALLAMYGLGCILAAAFLLPPALSMAEIERSSHPTVYDYMAAKDVFALVFDIENSAFSHDISMRSLFIGIPAMALLALGLPDIRRWNPWVAVACLLALVMACGLAHPLLAKAIHPLGLSRFTFVDYRGVLGLGLILFAVWNLEHSPLTSRRLLWLLPLVAWLVLGAFVLKLMPGHIGELAQALIALSLAVTVLFFVPARFAAPALLILIVADWARVQWSRPYFNLARAEGYFEEKIGTLDAARTTLIPRLKLTQPCRPERLDIPQEQNAQKPWRGYYTGDYMMQDYSGPMQFLRTLHILQNPDLAAFARQPWRAVGESVPENPTSFVERVPTPVLTCDAYGPGRIEYSVHNPTPRLVVENEVFWDGWRARVIGPDGRARQTLQPEDTQGFRGWRLPAGDYRLVATYTTPYRRLGFAISAMGLLLWLAAIFQRRRLIPTIGQGPQRPEDE